MGKMIYFVKEAFRGFFQAKLMTFVSIITIAVTLFFLGLLGGAFLNVQAWLQEASAQAALVVDLDDNLTREESGRQAFAEELKSFPQVAGVKVVTKEEAWERFEELHGSEMLKAVDTNPFTASVEVTLQNGHQSSTEVESLTSEIKALAGVDGVRYSREWLDTLKKIRSWFFIGGGIIAGVVLLALYFMITNTIKLTIYARKDLVTNMHFVGATDLYIKMPFILEGMLQGVVGGAIALGSLEFVKLLLIRMSLYWGPWWVFPVSVLFLGVSFGWIGSVSAVRKFLA